MTATTHTLLAIDSPWKPVIKAARDGHSFTFPFEEGVEQIVIQRVVIVRVTRSWILMVDALQNKRQLLTCIKLKNLVS